MSSTTARIWSVPRDTGHIHHLVSLLLLDDLQTSQDAYTALRQGIHSDGETVRRWQSTQYCAECAPHARRARRRAHRDGRHAARHAADHVHAPVRGSLGGARETNRFDADRRTRLQHLFDCLATHTGASPSTSKWLTIVDILTRMCESEQNLMAMFVQHQVFVDLLAMTHKVSMTFSTVSMKASSDVLVSVLLLLTSALPHCRGMTAARLADLFALLWRCAAAVHEKVRVTVDRVTVALVTVERVTVGRVTVGRLL